MKISKSRLVKILSIALIALIVLAVAAYLVITYLQTARETADLASVTEPETVITDEEPSTEPPAEPAPDNPTAPTDSAYPKTLFYKDGVLIVNKKHRLPADYSPGENPEAVANLKNLIAAGQAAGLDLIYSWSGFRSYATQASLYNSYAAQDGIVLTDTYSARPGFSEHQTGLAFDLKDHTGNLYRINDQTYNPATDWVALHAHEFGFIVRYFNATQSITGYSGEPWHLRYLGTNLATKVYQSGLTLEEYLGVPGGGYVD
jgi:D-alanyl-D-alanine carboxypeptidase